MPIFSTLLIFCLSRFVISAIVRTPSYEIVDGDDGFSLINEINYDSSSDNEQEIEEKTLPSVIDKYRVSLNPEMVHLSKSKESSQLDKRIANLDARQESNGNVIREAIKKQAAISSIVAKIKATGIVLKKSDFLSLPAERLRISYLISRNCPDASLAYNLFQTQNTLGTAIKSGKELMLKMLDDRETYDSRWNAYLVESSMDNQTVERVFEEVCKSRDALLKLVQVIETSTRSLESLVEQAIHVTVGLEKELIKYFRSLIMDA